MHKEPSVAPHDALDVVQTYWDARPCNIRHSLKPVGSKEYFDEVERRRYFVEPHIPGFAQFEQWRHKKVLELGCGIGTDTINFARAGALVTAVDLSEKSLELAHKRAEVFELTDQIAFRQANIEELPKFIPIQNFDLVYAFGVIHHTPNPDKSIASIRKYMGPSSELRMMVYAKNSWKRIMIDAGFDQPEAQFGCPIAFTYSEEEARALLHGFDVLNIKQDHIFPFVIEKYIRHEYEIVPWFAAMPSDMFQALKSNLGWHLLITAKLPV